MADKLTLDDKIKAYDEIVDGFYKLSNVPRGTIDDSHNPYRGLNQYFFELELLYVRKKILKKYPNKSLSEIKDKYSKLMNKYKSLANKAQNVHDIKSMNNYNIKYNRALLAVFAFNNVYKRVYTHLAVLKEHAHQSLELTCPNVLVFKNAIPKSDK